MAPTQVERITEALGELNKLQRSIQETVAQAQTDELELHDAYKKAKERHEQAVVAASSDTEEIQRRLRKLGQCLCDLGSIEDEAELEALLAPIGKQLQSAFDDLQHLLIRLARSVSDFEEAVTESFRTSTEGSRTEDFHTGTETCTSSSSIARRV